MSLSVTIDDTAVKPFIDQISDQLREQIRSGQLKVGDRIPSLRKLSETLGVSTGIVRQALSELSNEGYVRIYHGRGVFATDPLELKQNIALVLPCLTMGHIFRMIQGVKQAISERSSNLVLQAADLDFEQEMDMIHKLDRGNIAGSIIYPPLMNKVLPALQELQRRRVPAVLIDTVPEGLDGMDSFTSDNVAMGEMAMEYLLSRGHRKIGIVDIDTDVLSVKHIRIGIAKACSKYGIEYDSIPRQAQPCLAIKDNIWDEPAKLTVELLRKHPDVTAILGTNENITAGVFCGLKRMGKKIPTDISLIGLGYHDAFELSSPGITVVDRQYEKIGFLAGKRLLEIMNQTNVSSMDVRIDPVLREGESVIAV